MKRTLSIWVIASLLLLAACTAPASTTQPPLLSTGGPVSSQATGEITLHLLADNSSAEVITELSRNFEAVTPGVKVEPYFGSSHQIIDKLASGDPVDVLITASGTQMDSAAEIWFPIDRGRTGVIRN